MANKVFNENKIVSTLVSEKDEHGYLRKTDKTNDPSVFLTADSWSVSTFNFAGVFKGTYVMSNRDVTYTFIISDEDPLTAVIADEEVPGKTLTTASGASCLTVNLARTRCAMSTSIEASSLSEDENAQMTKIWNYHPSYDMSDVTLKLWLIVKTTDSRPVQLRNGEPATAYCEFLFTKDHASSFAPLYRYEELAE